MMIAHRRVFQTASNIARSIVNTNKRFVSTIQYAKQDQLFIHQHDNGLTTVSFSKDPNKQYIGALKTSDATKGSRSDLSEFEITPETFVENKDFVGILHDTYKRHVDEDQSYILEAMNYPGSYMAIADYKIILEYMNQRPELPNTLGFVHVGEDGVMIKNSYQKNDTYTLCNIDGIIKIPEFMAEQLQKYL